MWTSGEIRLGARRDGEGGHAWDWIRVGRVTFSNRIGRSVDRHDSLRRPPRHCPEPFFNLYEAGGSAGQYGAVASSLPRTAPTLSRAFSDVGKPMGSGGQCGAVRGSGKFTAPRHHSLPQHARGDTHSFNSPWAARSSAGQWRVHCPPVTIHCPNTPGAVLRACRILAKRCRQRVRCRQEFCLHPPPLHVD